MRIFLEQNSKANPRPRILFVSHSASRNGATIMLLHFLRWLKTRVDYPIEILVHGTGDLLDEFKAIGPTKVWRNFSFVAASLPRAWQAVLKPWIEAQSLRLMLANRKYDLVYVNTVAPSRQLPLMAKRSESILWHIHELNYALRLNLGSEGHHQVFPLANQFVAASNSVRDALADEFQVPKEKIEVVHEFIPLINLSLEARKTKRRQLLEQLGWPQTAFVVGGCGSLGWRKGTDLFLQIAKNINMTKGYEEVRFLWVGGNPSDRDSLEFNHDLRVLRLQDHCCCVPNTADILDYYCAMDVFALTSREDPFPLVMLEAAAQSLPIVCFAESGGGPEFVEKNAGFIAPYLDTLVFSERLRSLYDQPDLRRQLGTEAARKVREQYNIEIQGPTLLRCIENCLAAIPTSSP